MVLVAAINWLVFEWFWNTNTTPLDKTAFSLLSPVIGLKLPRDSGAIDDFLYNNLKANRNAVQWASSAGLFISTNWYMRISISGVLQILTIYVSTHVKEL